MTLIDRYLRSVRDYLPASGQADIIRELSEDLSAQVADREAELGHPLSDAEQEALLKQYGHPLLLASRYRPQHHLIGPALFPFYILAMKVAIGIALVVHVGMAVSMVVTGSPIPDVLGLIARFPFGAAITVFGWVTAAFAIVDLTLEQARRGEWSPRSLRSGPRLSPRIQLIFELAAATGGFFWWLAIPGYPVLLLGPAAAFAQLAPIFDRLYLPITALWTIGLLTLWALVVRTDWLRYRHAARIVLNLAGILVASLFLAADALVVPLAVAGADAARLAHVIDTTGRIGLGVYIAFCWFEIAKAGLAIRRDEA